MGIWFLLKRAMANFADPSLDHLIRIVKRKLKKIQYRPHLIDGCLAKTGLVSWRNSQRATVIAIAAGRQDATANAAI